MRIGRKNQLNHRAFNNIIVDIVEGTTSIITDFLVGGEGYKSEGGHQTNKEAAERILKLKRGEMDTVHICIYNYSLGSRAIPHNL